MRIFSVPAALFLAYFLFTLLPAAARWVEAAIAGAYRRLLPPFTRKSGKARFMALVTLPGPQLYEAITRVQSPKISYSDFSMRAAA